MSEGHIRFTRRMFLAGTAVVGAVGPGVGLGTNAQFSDDETFDGNDVVAGQLDLKVAWRKVVTQRDRTVEESSDFPEPTNDVDAPICVLEDVKPGDSGHIEFVLQIDDNPGYLSLVGAEATDEEKGQSELERGAVSESIPPERESEPGEFLETAVSYGSLGSGGVTADTEAYTASLASLIDLGSVGTGLLLDGGGSMSVTDIILANVSPHPFQPGRRYGIHLDFVVPATVGNVIQTDSYRFTIGFYGEQARNNNL